MIVIKIHCERQITIVLLATRSMTEDLTKTTRIGQKPLIVFQNCVWCLVEITISYFLRVDIQRQP